MAGHKPRVIWSPEALDDIDRLWTDYADRAGRVTADKTLREVARIVATIDDFPFAGRSRDEIPAGLRSLAASPQVVFYRLKLIGRKSYAYLMDVRISKEFSPQAEFRILANYPTAFAAALPAFLPENKQPPRNVPSSER